ncbi:MAG: FAD-binding oxidoreductase [Candidatus Latescibacteria bacterium]|jgi:D-amino-acid dehydrogenase|nr:FAD-binding oxidoreductase [Candidatus Latescibacterota bacterium]
MYDVIVVGGGIVGVSTAYSLLREGLRVLLIDRSDAGRATDAGAGIVSPIPYNGESHPIFGMLTNAFRYYDEIIEDLDASQVGDTGFARCGKLVVAASSDEMDAFRSAQDAILSYRSTYADAEELYVTTPDTAKEMFPPLTTVLGAIYYKNAARVDGRLLTEALKKRSRQLGLLARSDSVTDLVIDEGKVVGVLASRETIEAKHVVIAGGAWSSAFGEQLGIDIPVSPQRGQICHLDLGEEIDSSEWPIVTAFHDHYLVPWSDHKVVVGATRESGVGFKPYTTAAGLNETLTEALRIAPGLAEASIREVRVGLRPLSADRLPVIGPIPGVEGVQLVTGHGPSGLHLGPYSGKLIADRIMGLPISSDAAMFEINRFL